ncbi:hypothetical protein EBU99_15315, partial [bacterium]|nr:hypothetical protein [bacterium]
KARSLRAQADAAKAQADEAEAQARLNAAQQSTAVVTSTPRARPGATSDGGNFVTHDEFNKFRSEVQTGFTHLSEQNQMTHNVLARFVNMMNPGLPASATAPVSRQIGNSPQEVVEPPRQSYGQNAGWNPAAAEKPGFAPQSSFRASSAIACGGDAHSFHREPVKSSTPVHRGSMPNFEAAAARWNKKNNANNSKILDAIRQMARGNDDMACLLLALVNGKTLSEIVNMYSAEVGELLSTRNTSFFQRFFTALSSCGLPANFDVKVDSSKTNSGHGFCMTYQQLSQAPGNVDKLVMILRGE